MKDLVDLVLLIEKAKLDATRLAKSIRETFQRRNTHSIPIALSPPPASWSVRFSEMAEECGIDTDIQKHFTAVGQFYRELNL